MWLGMLSYKRASFILISSSTLALIFGVYVTSASIAFAYYCSNKPPVVPGRTECCDFANGRFWCTTCDDTQPPSGCTPRYPGRTAGETAPPTNLAPPKVCPDGSSPDANGKCPTTTTGNQNPQSLTNNNNNNGGGSNGNNNNNVLSQQQNNKGSNLLGHVGELTGKKKGSSPTPPPCPEGNEPIPPNCTLKPKF